MVNLHSQLDRIWNHRNTALSHEWVLPEFLTEDGKHTILRSGVPDRMSGGGEKVRRIRAIHLSIA